ncbi:GPMC system family 4 glycosyltransferase [Geobacter argillaceus]|uniref:Glycosyltransferase involved in cell wall biosynthesis n=1 Tax=Geobacter argillaceus TaxID=345631 RepID=A0A562VL20_9BACT|nr:GPMC system family 4 glycosyltransferase [Geobacter argillaceus]TWJ18666.1 glycosyltransferase involved in cell wall biosynthesis [Geobacter argillaceus]
MRVAIVSPYSVGPMRGNITTVRRIRRFLEQLETETIVLPADTLSASEMRQLLTSFAPDIIHGFHARYCGETTRQLANELSAPYLITITGSDINDPTLRNHPDTARAVVAAAAIACFDDHEAKAVATHFPDTGKRIFVIPQGIEPPPVTGHCPFEFPENALVLLLPAALRPVKNVAFPIRALPPLLGDNPALLLAIAGGVIDQSYATAIRDMLAASSCARWLGEVPYEQMGDLYVRADIVLNCSLFEGMPNSLLEAMALGRPVLAVDIPGNRSLVRDGETGVLFRDETDFRRQLLRLANDPTLRANCGRNAREYVLTQLSPTREAEGYLRLYKTVLHR